MNPSQVEFPIHYGSLKYNGRDVAVYDKLEFNEMIDKRRYGGEFVMLTAKKYHAPTSMQPKLMKRKVLGTLKGQSALLRMLPKPLVGIVVSLAGDTLRYAISNVPFEQLKAAIQQENDAAEQEKDERLQAIAVHNARYLHMLKDRRTSCHKCGKRISTQENYICLRCKWIQCDCGGCGCNYTRRYSYY